MKKNANKMKRELTGDTGGVTFIYKQLASLI